MLPTEHNFGALLGALGITSDTHLERLGNPDLGILDSRTAQEYSGEKAFSQRGGHLPGASNLNWIDTMDQDRNLRLKPDADLRAMLKNLGYTRIKGYPGSWSDWGNRADTPVE